MSLTEVSHLGYIQWSENETNKEGEKNGIQGEGIPYTLSNIHIIAIQTWKIRYSATFLLDHVS